MSVWRGADDVPHSGILPPYEAGWWPDPASFCRQVSCQVADITSHVKHTTTTTTDINVIASVSALNLPIKFLILAVLRR